MLIESCGNVICKLSMQVLMLHGCIPCPGFKRSCYKYAGGCYMDVFHAPDSREPVISMQVDVTWMYSMHQIQDNLL